MIRSLNKICLIVLVFIFAASSLGGYASAASNPANTAPGSTLEQRIAQRKKERKIKLDEINKTRLQNQCVYAQANLRTLTDSYSKTADNRDKVYRGIDAKLWIIIGSLKLINKDTFKLEQQRQEYLKRVLAFENQSNQFQQTINDMLAMNCKADPTGFKALLETARLYNAQIRSSFIGIRSYLIDQVQQTVSQQADDLKLKTSTE